MWLLAVHSFKYFGVTLSSNLCWLAHVKALAVKVRKLLGVFFVDDFVSSWMLGKWLQCIIRPHLEYASAIWDPHLACDIALLENVQKFASENGGWVTLTFLTLVVSPLLAIDRSLSCVCSLSLFTTHSLCVFCRVHILFAFAICAFLYLFLV